MNPARILIAIATIVAIATILLPASISFAIDEGGCIPPQKPILDDLDGDDGDERDDQKPEPQSVETAPADFTITISSQGGFANRFSTLVLTRDGMVVSTSGSADLDSDEEPVVRKGKLTEAEMLALWKAIKASGILALEVNRPQPAPYYETVTINGDGTNWYHGGSTDERFTNGMAAINETLHKALQRGLESDEKPEDAGDDEDGE